MTAVSTHTMLRYPRGAMSGIPLLFLIQGFQITASGIEALLFST